jgi:hypothetical protein
MYTAEIPKSMHIKDLIFKQMKTTQDGHKALPSFAKMYPSMLHTPSPFLQEKWKKHLYQSFLCSGILEHSFTCKKPPSGKDRCQGAMPKGNCPSTLPVLLELPEEVDALGEDAIKTARYWLI